MASSQFPTHTLETMRTVLPAALVLVLFALGSSPASGNDESEDLPELEVLARYEIPEMEDRIIGVQWASKDSIYLGLFERGVVEVKLREGLPEVAHLLEPRGGMPNRGLSGIVRFDVSDDWVVASHDRFAWARRNSSGGPVIPMVQRTVAGAFDFAVDGDRVVMWGRPDKAHWEDAKGGILWRADLSKGLDRWEVLYENAEVATDPGLIDENFATRGSVEFLDDGDVLLAPNAPRVLPALLRFSYQGKLRETWTAGEIWDGEEGQVLEGAEKDTWTEGPVEAKDFERFLGNRRTVDAVLSLPEGPAIVTRDPRGGKTAWRLALLLPEIRWYAIPFSGVSSVAQLRGDTDDEGRIVIIGAAREMHEGARVRKNEVVILRLPPQ